MKATQNIYRDWTLRQIHTEWAVLMGCGERLGDPVFRNEVLAFARQMMRRARECFERIIEQLSADGYRFACPERTFVPPELDAADWIEAYRERGIHLPIVLQAWLTEVGIVNLTGSHPAWSRPGCLFEDGGNTDPLYTDAFVCEVTSDYVEYLREEWNAMSPDDRPPFRIDFSADRLHKANISGGPPYELDASRPAIDTLVLNESHCTSFVGLVRLALRWRGFPGFEYIEDEGEWSRIGLAVI